MEHEKGALYAALARTSRKCTDLLTLTGTSLVTEKDILDLPTGVVSFYMDTVDPRTPGMRLVFFFLILTFV